MTCKDCIHAEVCLDMNGFVSFELKGMGGDCENFADKSLYIKLPCKVGTPVYKVESGRSKMERIEIDGKIYSRQIPQRHITVHKYSLEDYAIGYEIGKHIFLTREEAEAALERSKGE